MKRLLSIFIVLSLLLSLSITAFALNTEVNDGTSFINTMQSVVGKEDVTLTQNCIAIPTTLYSNMRIVVETESATNVKGFICWAAQIYGVTQAQAFIGVSSSVCTISAGNSCTIETASGDYGSMSSQVENSWILFNLLTPLTAGSDDVKITIKMYGSSALNALPNDDDLKTSITYTFNAPEQVDEPDANYMDITAVDVSSVYDGTQVYVDDTVSVKFTSSSGWSNTSGKTFALKYNSEVFALAGALPDGLSETEGTITGNAAAFSEKSIEFKALAQDNDNVDGSFSFSESTGTSSLDSGKVTVILKPIQFTVTDSVEKDYGSYVIYQVNKTYDGQQHTFDIVVTEPANGVTIEYNDTQDEDSSYTDDKPVYTDASSSDFIVKITAKGYREQDVYVSFAVKRAPVTITPEDITINAGDPLPPNFKFKVSGLLNDDTLEIVPNIYVNDYTGQPGTYSIVAYGAVSEGNYSIAYATGKLTVKDVWIVKLDDTEYKVEKGDPFTFPSAPTKPGYIFMGWRGADGATYQPGDEVAISGDTSFKAVWANMPDVTPGGGDEPDVDVFPFYDVSVNAWYYDAVKYVWDNGLMNGTGTAEFSPNTTLNRAMVWTILARLDGVDVDGGASWYAKAQEWAVAEGVSDGTDPMGAVTREQLVTMLWRFKGEPTVDFLLTSPDADTISDWAREAMRWAVSNGIIEGDENGCITPTATATRAQAAAIFMRFVEQ